MHFDQIGESISLKRRAATESTLADPYFQMEFSGIDEPWKQPQRERILEFILKHHSEHGMKFFGFPSAWWRFENMLLESRKGKASRTQFLGIERSWQILEYGVRHMPGSGKMLLDYPMSAGRIEGYRSSIATSIHFRAEDFWTLGRAWKGGGSSNYRFARQFKGWSCAWIDPFTPLRGNFLESLHRVGGHFEISKRDCPIAISFPIGRDDCPAGEGEETLESRVRVATFELSRTEWREFIPMDSFEYKRPGHSLGWGTLMGIFRTKK